MAIRATVLCSSFLLVAGCHAGTSSPSRPVSTGSAARPALSVGAIDAGTCWQVPPTLVADQHYWYDDSPSVPCSEPHTTETAFVYPLSQPQPRTALKEVGDRCHDYVRAYVGISDSSWIPWGTVMLLPSKDEIRHGASWLRCDVFFPATTGLSEPRETSIRGHDAARHPPAALWGCLNQPPDPTRRQRYADCTKPHLFEATGNIVHTPPTSRYPPASVRARAAQQCDSRVPQNVGIVPAVLWGSVVEGANLSGACMFHRTDGRLLPPR